MYVKKTIKNVVLFLSFLFIFSFDFNYVSDQKFNEKNVLEFFHLIVVGQSLLNRVAV